MRRADYIPLDPELAAMDAPEPTARDPFTQLDRRMSRLEDSFRELRRFVESRFETLEDRMTSNFRWLVGTQFASWMSVMATLLLR